MKKQNFELVNAETIHGYKKYLPAGYPAISTIWKRTENIVNKTTFNIYSSEELLKKYISH